LGEKLSPKRPTSKLLKLRDFTVERNALASCRLHSGEQLKAMKLKIVMTLDRHM
jgi:hypothetical protein